MTTTSERFDLSFQGELAPGADPEHTRQRLAALFKLDEQGAARLFSGRPVVVRRAVDAHTRDRYVATFAEAGAVLRVDPAPPEHDEPRATAAETATAPLPRTRSVAVPASQPPDDRRDVPAVALSSGAAGLGTSLSLAAPGGGGPLEATPLTAVAVPAIDHLSLVTAERWTLEDCAPPPVAIAEPDLGHLSLAPMEPRVERAEADFDQ